MKTMLKYLAGTVLTLVLAFHLNSCDEELLPPFIAAFNPASGAVGDEITITGSYFEVNPAGNIVKFNGVTGTVTAATATELKVKVPAGATTGKITVSARQASAVSVDTFTVTESMGSLTFEPTSGKFGATVTITGQNFDTNIGGNVVKFNGVTATVLSATATQLQVKLNNGGSTGKVSVTTNNGTAISATDFMYIKSWIVSDFAGSGSNGSANGTGSGASFSNMTNMAIDSAGNVYVADELNNLIRKITPAGVATTIAGAAGEGYQDGPVATARFYMPVAVAVDAAGNIYVADSFNNIIRKISTNGIVSTVAGQQQAGYNDGTGTEARFNNPHGVCVDTNGNLFIADNLNNRIRKITPAGVVTTFAGSGAYSSQDGTGTSASVYNPWGLTIDKDNNLYIADTFGEKIRKITPAGVVTTLAGSGVTGWADGQGTAAQFDRPTGVSVDLYGNVYAVEHLNSTVRMITPGGLVTTIAGAAHDNNYINGPGEDARFYNPYSVTNNGAGTILYIADQGNRRVRKMELK